ncbi:GNAT family N-acetyltransferase [Vibrio sonorensis]|uniref:GNAT family N-acetyltransferase n=1 Tax=Vibrio sonorensis TaxID=1004316 RepID=UPI0008D8DE8E|nr:GNAT family N-acetyltransferase [Vibrio sonorensis]
METERLLLLPPAIEHQPLLLDAIIKSQHELGKYLDWVPDNLTHEATIESTLKAIDNYQNFEKELRFSIFEKESMTFLGLIGLIIRDKTIPFFEMGYWLSTEHHGKGYVTEAVQAVEQYAFQELGAQRLEIKAAKSNLKSLAIAKRHGYQYEGTLRRARKLPSGELDDIVIYSKIANH